MVKVKLTLIILVSLLLISLCAAASGNIVGVSGNQWSMFRDNLSHSGYTEGNNSAPGTALLWKYTTGAAILSSPAVAEGFVFVGSEDNYIYCLNQSCGKLVWRFPTGSVVESSPAIENGYVYITSEDGYLYCLNVTDGMPLWVRWIGGFAQSSPAVVNDRVYVGSGKNNVYCLNASDGSLIWGYQTTERVMSSPAVSDGVVYFATDDFFVYAVNASTGVDLWHVHTGSTVSSPTLSGGYLYIGSYDGYVCALNASTGDMVWKYQTGDQVSSSPAVANGYVYIGSNDNNVYCLRASDGKPVWQSPTGYWVWSSPSVCGGSVYVGSEDYNIYCFNASTGTKQWSYPTGGYVDSSAAIADGVLYVGSGDHNIYALTLNNEKVDTEINQTANAFMWSTAIFDIAAEAVVFFVVYAFIRFVNGKRKMQATDAAEGKRFWLVRHSEVLFVLVILVFSLVFFVNLGSATLWAADEQTYSQWAFHMVKSGDYLTPWAFGGVSVWIGKPPLNMWLMALFYQAFGVSNFTSRLTSALLGSATLVLVYFLGKKLYNPSVGFLSAIILGTFTTFFEFAQRAMTDVPFVFFVVGSIYFFVLTEKAEKTEKTDWYAVLSGAFFGLALMTKQVQAMLIPLVIFTYLILTRKSIRFLFTKPFTLFWGIAFLVFAPWLVYMTASYGPQFWQWFIVYSEYMRTVASVEGHNGGYLYYFSNFAASENLLYVVLLPIAAVFCIFNAAVKRLKQDTLIIAWMVMVLLVFTIAQTKLDYYILAAYPAFAIAIATLLYWTARKTWSFTVKQLKPHKS